MWLADSLTLSISTSSTRRFPTSIASFPSHRAFKSWLSRAAPSALTHYHPSLTAMLLPQQLMERRSQIGQSLQLERMRARDRDVQQHWSTIGRIVADASRLPAANTLVNGNADGDTVTLVRSAQIDFSRQK